MGPKDMPGWESDFWQGLMDEYITAPGGWSVPKDTFYDMGEATGRYGSAFKADPDWVFEETTEVSRFDNGNVIVGEIVEEHQGAGNELTA